LDFDKININNYFGDKFIVWHRYVKPKHLLIINKPKMQGRRYRAVKSNSNKAAGEKSDTDPPDNILYSKAKFVPFSWDEFGFFYFIKHISTLLVKCRSPPPFLIFDFSKFRNGGKYNVK
jgi:hypothetical protein